jgi:hypothetical protein
MPAACHPTWWGAGQVQVKLWARKEAFGNGSDRAGPGGAAAQETVVTEDEPHPPVRWSHRRHGV